MLSKSIKLVDLVVQYYGLQEGLQFVFQLVPRREVKERGQQVPHPLTSSRHLRLDTLRARCTQIQRIHVRNGAKRRERPAHDVPAEEGVFLVPARERVSAAELLGEVFCPSECAAGVPLGA